MTIIGYWQSLIKKSDFSKRSFPSPINPDNPVIGSCPKCGLELRKAMWYCCQKSDCPTGLGGGVRL